MLCTASPVPPGRAAAESVGLEYGRNPPSRWPRRAGEDTLLSRGKALEKSQQDSGTAVPDGTAVPGRANSTA